MKSIFEKMGGTYRQAGDYLIPNLTLANTGAYQIGKYGRMRRRHLKEYHPRPLFPPIDQREVPRASVGDRPDLP